MSARKADPRLDDEARIRDLVAHYADAVTRQEAGEVSLLFAPTGVWTVTGYGTHEGRAAVREFLAGLLVHWDTIVHALLSGRVALDPGDPDRARGRWYISEFGVRTDGTEVFFAGVYHDEYVQRDGTWYFDRRRYDSMFRRVGGEVSTSPFPTL